MQDLSIHVSFFGGKNKNNLFFSTSASAHEKDQKNWRMFSFFNRLKKEAKVCSLKIHQLNQKI
jgi:hypothetical protein